MVSRAALRIVHRPATVTRTFASSAVRPANNAGRQNNAKEAASEAEGVAKKVSTFPRIEATANTAGVQFQNTGSIGSKFEEGGSGAYSIYIEE